MARKRGNIRASWNFEKKHYYVVENKKKIKKTKNKIILTSEELIKKIVEHDKELLRSIRDGKIKKDKLKIIYSIRRNIKKGDIIGTKEAIIKKFIKIKTLLDSLNKINYQILDNIYMSAIESSQTLLIVNGVKSLTPRLMPKNLRSLDKKIRDNIHINYIEEIIKTFKDFEHKEIKMPSPKKLDDLREKAQIIKNEVEDLL